MILRMLERRLLPGHRRSSSGHSSHLGLVEAGSVECAYGSTDLLLGQNVG